MLKLNASFDESMEYFDQFISAHKDNDEMKEFVEQAIIDRSGCETAKEELGSAANAVCTDCAEIQFQLQRFCPRRKRQFHPGDHKWKIFV